MSRLEYSSDWEQQPVKKENLERQCSGKKDTDEIPAGICRWGFFLRKKSGG